MTKVHVNLAPSWADLGRRAVACDRWRWMPGMSLMRRRHGPPAGGTGLRPTALRVAVTGGHPCDPWAGIADADACDGLMLTGQAWGGGKDIEAINVSTDGGKTWSSATPANPHWVPDFRDPATRGCLLALVRDALGEPLATVEVRQPGSLGCRACVRVPVESKGWRMIGWWRASQDAAFSEAEALVAALEESCA